jgi:hypothetical protein
MLRTFQALKATSDFRRTQLSFVRTLEDLELVREIGFHQAAGRPTTLQLLFLKNYGTLATIQRRLNRLKRLGVIDYTKSIHDKRVVHLTLSQDVWERHVRLGKLMRKIWGNGARR